MSGRFNRLLRRHTCARLASIQTVNAVEPIPNADAIEKIRVLGWWVVVKKGEHRPGDKLVYCEIDSLLPERPEFEFLRREQLQAGPDRRRPAQTILPAGFRIKTVKLRGQVSQGICFPLSILPPGAPTEEGADVTDLLGVLKWEPPLPVGMGGKVKGQFPGFLPKTDETRVQVLEAGARAAPRQDVLRHRETRRHVVHRVPPRRASSASAAGTSGWTRPTRRTSWSASPRA